MALSCCHINVRSLVAHFSKFKELVYEKYDVITVSETWLNPGILDEIIDLKGYRLYRRDRTTRGGGVAVYVRSNHKSHLIQLPEVRNSEQVWVSVKFSIGQYAIGSLYRPPDFSAVDFLGELESAIGVLEPLYTSLIVLGDLNINLLNFSGTHTKNILNLFESFNMSQMINEPTRIGPTSATLLDLIAHSQNIKKITSKVYKPGIADHSLISCKLLKPKIRPTPSFYTFRDIKNIDHDNFAADLNRMSFDQIFNVPNIDLKVDILNNVILSLFDFYAPVKTVKISKRSAPWLTGALKMLMRSRDKALLKFKKTKNYIDWNFYKYMRNEVNHAIKREKTAFYQYRCRNVTQKNLWKELKTLNLQTNKNHDNQTLPLQLQDPTLINDHFLSTPNLVPDTETVNFLKTNKRNNNMQSLNFHHTSADDIYKALLSIKSNAMGPDGLSITMLLMCCPRVLPIIEHIFNFIITHNIYPAVWKKSIVFPLPKTNNPENFNDLRPISLLSVLSKVLEKILDEQIRSFLDANHILPVHQSGFRKGYSCTTALTKVTDDIFCGTDANKVTVLVLIDFSKAFDCINHELLIELLGYLGFSMQTCKFFKSYLSSRLQAVRTNKGVSNFAEVDNGVPQGSVLGPLLFTLYTSLFSEVFQHCSYHCYADDTQLYMSFEEDDVDLACTQINADLSKLVNISKKYALNINPFKSKIMLFGRTVTVGRIRNSVNIFLDNEQLVPCDEVKNLGLVLDDRLRFDKHVAYITKRAFGVLKLIYAQKQFLNRNCRKILCESLVLSHLNYGDVVYGPNLLCRDSRRLQLIQNACVRLICGLRRGSHITASTRQLGWLSMEKRRLLHLAVYSYKIIKESTPPYLYNKISFRTSVHNINTRYRHTLNIPRHKTCQFRGSFSYQVASVFNKLPDCFKSLSYSNFKRKVREWIFNT